MGASASSAMPAMVLSNIDLAMVPQVEIGLSARSIIGTLPT